MVRQRGVNTYAVELPLFCILLYTPFWIILIEVDIRLKLNCYFFGHFLDFVLFTFWISTKSYNTGQFFLLANQRLPFLLLVDIGYSVVLFYILVYVLTV